jgi:hypothetical protein
MIDVIKNAWGWCGLEPAEVVGENAFGNVLVKDSQGRYWRLCPEDLTCSILAANTEQFKALIEQPDFQANWEVPSWVEQAVLRLGSLGEGQKYCLKMPSVLGGTYDAENFGIISFEELLSFSGYLAEQIKDLPDGAQIKLTLKD